MARFDPPRRSDPQDGSAHKGPWSDLPPPPLPPRQPLFRPRKKASAAREPLIRNWRGLLIIVFLLFVAPMVANWVAHLIMERISGGGL